ncbi:type IV secretory system conjugative DNA transfer family protein [Gilliamella sp. B2824]|uniref:type IV secretory system conjugative DNA transfer family protein n=1 Tax=Gilliamella sp. B2824 TaxID=2818019 RepID=UPI00226AF054|nr:type IV secretory system conjugative DNA transfer family protein [Gilliamella sp. B2824]MCX8738122.1 type IV secretory system conjugative DNA transfer family protein [Gilliamella sp. B2824]
MNRQKKISLFCFALLVTLAFTIGSQYVAGFIFMKIKGLDVASLGIFSFWKYYFNYRQFDSNQVAFICGFIGMAITFLLPFIFTIIILSNLRKKEELFGSARLANDMDLSKSGLFPSNKELMDSKYPAVLIGKMHKGRYKGKFLQFIGQQFIYIAAPTRSGKGVGVVIPNLLNYRDSVVVLDVKLENFIYTGGYRKSKGQEVFLFCPDGYSFTDAEFNKFKSSDKFKSMSEEEQNDIINRYEKGELLRSHRYNPLTYINRNPNFRDGDIMNIGKILYPNSGGDNDVWNELAINLFKGLVLYMLDLEYTDMPVTMAQLLTLTSPEQGLATWMDEEIEIADLKGRPLSDGCIAEFRRFMATPERTQGSILSTLTAPLSIFTNAACKAATAGDDFDLRDVRTKRMSIYLGLAPTSLMTYAKLTNLFFSQLISVNTKTLPEQDPSLKYQCLLVLDEFTSMGKVEIIEKSIAYTAGYNLRYMIIIQTRGQIENDKLYGKEGAKVLIDNCAVQINYPPKLVSDDAKIISETIGKKTVKVKNKSNSRSKGGASKSDNFSEQGRDVLLPQEVVELGSEVYITRAGKKTNLGINEIVIMEKVRPFIAHKIVYFDEPAFIERKTFSENNIIDVPLLNLKFNSFTSTHIV